MSYLETRIALRSYLCDCVLYEMTITCSCTDSQLCQIPAKESSYKAKIPKWKKKQKNEKNLLNCLKLFNKFTRELWDVELRSLPVFLALSVLLVFSAWPHFPTKEKNTDEIKVKDYQEGLLNHPTTLVAVVINMCCCSFCAWTFCCSCCAGDVLVQKNRWTAATNILVSSVA